MKRISKFLLFAFLISGVLYISNAQEVLSNQNIVNMVQGKLDRKLIISKIQNTPNNFDLSAVEMVKLKNANVSAQIMEEMILNCKNLPVMNNQEVLAMQEGNVSKDVIIKKINFSNCDFNVETDALIKLKAAKVPDSVINAMMAANTNGKSAPSTTTSAAAGTSAPAVAARPELPTPPMTAFNEPGIYYEKYKPSTQYEQLEPTTTNNKKTDAVGNVLSNGLANKKDKVGLTGTTSNTVINDTRPVFYFVFEGSRKDMNTANEDMFSGVASPNDFVLMTAKVTKTGREIVISKSNVFGSESGFNGGAIPFRFKKISNQLYKIYFEQDLPVGEYAFYYNKGSEARSSLKLYDFSLKR